MAYKSRPCAHCGVTIFPTNSRNKHCSWQCRFRDIYSTIAPDANGCLNWPLKPNPQTGYGLMAVSPGHPATAHRLSWIVHNGEIPSGLWILHKCDNRPCVNPEHLFLGTGATNVQDMWGKGRQQNYTSQPRGDGHPLRRNPQLAARGDRHGMAKCTDEIARAIKATKGGTAKEVAARFGVSKATVDQIRTKRTWKHV